MLKSQSVVPSILFILYNWVDSFFECLYMIFYSSPRFFFLVQPLTFSHFFMLQGQIRGKIMGKRCNRSSRSVIGPDATIDIHQLVVPIEICMIQTYPETVTNFNLMQLKERIVNGPDVLFGAKVVDALNGQKIDLAMIDEKKRKQIQLRPGMVVHRHLQKGDLVGFNRQPSLHKESMMGHEIIPMPGKTFRFHLAGKFTSHLLLYISLGAIYHG